MSRSAYKYIAKEDYEWRAGRIISWPALWVPQGKYLQMKEFYPTERDGRTIVMVEKKAVRCRNIELWNEDDYHIERKDNGYEAAWVPFSECQKCEHYMKGATSGRQRYPRCKLDREKRKDFRTPMELFNEAWKEAMP